MPSSADVAAWMVEELERVRYLYQDVVVTAIQTRFGDSFTYTNERGNLAIDRSVLREFRRLTQDRVVWERGERMWRYREAYDSDGRLAP